MQERQEQRQKHNNDLAFMVNLREELRMQMWNIYTRYDCARKVLTCHIDLQALPERQIWGALRHIWCDWIYTSMDTPCAAYKSISRANAKRMIETSQEHMRDRFDAVQAERLSVYMEDVVRHLERLQRGETEEEEQSRWFTKKKQQLWDNQYLKHHKLIASQKGSYEASFILEQMLGPETRNPTPGQDSHT